MKKILFFLIVIAVMYMAGQYLLNNPDKIKTFSQRVENVVTFTQAKDNCLAVKGQWNDEKKVCSLPTADAGKECKGSNDCAGACLATLTPEEEQLLMAQPGEHVLERTGSCSPWRPLVGCRQRLENGQISRISCQDE